MSSIDKAVEKHTDSEFIKVYEGPEPITKCCVICDKELTLEDGEWQDVFGYGQVDATETKNGFVCSNVCRSQLMYQSASDDDKRTLNSVADACRVLAEYGSMAQTIVNRNTDGHVPDSLVQSANDFLEAVQFGMGPEWLNTPTREGRLEGAIERGVVDVEYQAKLRKTEGEVNPDSEWLTVISKRQLDNIVLRLKESLK